MKTLNRRNISAALLLVLAAVLSSHANATEGASIESAINNMVSEQSQQVVSDLSAQIQQSIKEEINRFSIDFSFQEKIAESLTWRSKEESTAIVDVVKQTQ